MRTLVYVDHLMMVAIGSLLVGSSETNNIGGGASVNLLLNTHFDVGTGITRNLKDMLPEHVFYECEKKITNKYQDTKKATDALCLHGEGGLMPGTPISVAGILSFPKLQAYGNYDPFHPPSIDVEIFDIHGDRCFVGVLEKGGYRLPIYFPENSKSQVCFLQDEPVEIVGIIKWSPAYRAGGGKSLNKLIRSVALLLG